MRKLTAVLIGITFGGILGWTQNVGDTAPDFSYQSLSGDTLKLSDYQGKVVFLFLFGNGCPSCKVIGNDTETKVQEVYGARDDFQALGLDLWNSTSSVTTVTAFKSTTKITYPLLLKAGDLEEKYKTTYDRIIIIDKEGKIRHKGSTVVSNDLDAAIGVLEELFVTTDIADFTGPGESPFTGIYPNPVDETSSLHLNLAQKASVGIRIYHLSGQEILNLGVETIPAGKHIREIPAGDLPSGLYLIRATISGEVYTRKMVVR